MSWRGTNQQRQITGSCCVLTLLAQSDVGLKLHLLSSVGCRVLMFLAHARQRTVVFVSWKCGWGLAHAVTRMLKYWSWWKCTSLVSSPCVASANTLKLVFIHVETDQLYPSSPYFMNWNVIFFHCEHGCWCSCLLRNGTCRQRKKRSFPTTLWRWRCRPRLSWQLTQRYDVCLFLQLFQLFLRASVHRTVSPCLNRTCTSGVLASLLSISCCCQ